MYVLLLLLLLFKQVKNIQRHLHTFFIPPPIDASIDRINKHDGCYHTHYYT